MDGNKTGKANILGCMVDIVDRAQALELASRLISENQASRVVTLNPEIAVSGQNNLELRSLINSASLVTPDGFGVVWGGRQLGYPFLERVTGIDLALDLCERASIRGWKVYLLGAAPGVARQAAQNLEHQFPGLRICGSHHGYFDDKEIDPILQAIQTARPDILLVGLGAPKQEYWIEKYQEKLQIPLAMGVGGSLDVISGLKERAPEWAIRLNLEWLYRLLAEPSRWKRQLALPRFVIAIKRYKWFNN